MHKPNHPLHPPLTTAALIRWLENQPPDTEYVWQDPAFCLVGQYLADHGSSWGAAQYSELPGYSEIAETKPWTMGAALERARTLALPAPEPAFASPPLISDEVKQIQHTPALIKANPPA